MHQPFGRKDPWVKLWDPGNKPSPQSPSLHTNHLVPYGRGAAAPGSPQAGFCCQGILDCSMGAPWLSFPKKGRKKKLKKSNRDDSIWVLQNNKGTEGPCWKRAQWVTPGPTSCRSSQSLLQFCSQKALDYLSVVGHTSSFCFGWNLQAATLILKWDSTYRETTVCVFIFWVHNLGTPLFPTFWLQLS